MKILLDTNIVIHREATTVVHCDVGLLFRWMDNLRYMKCVHPVTVAELLKHKDPKTVQTLQVKLESYNVLKTEAPLAEAIRVLSGEIDKTPNDENDTRIINELYCDRVDILITEDKGLHCKAVALGLADRVFTIDAFLEKVSAENPALVDYRVLAVKKELFGNLDVSDSFFDSLRDDYKDFDKWFSRKADEYAYVCRSDGSLLAFLYVKVENESEDYSDILPPFKKSRRLKIGTLKVDLNGYRLGERFLKIVFDNARRQQVDEIYVTTFNKGIERDRLINMLEDYGFSFHGLKGGGELVYVRPFSPQANREMPRLTYPYFSTRGRIFIVPIYPEYHTELLPDSILRTESPAEFVENEPHRNAISKTYISRSVERQIASGDVIVFYRTGGYYKSVVSTIGIVENVVDGIQTEEEFVRLCRKRSVFSDEDLAKWWNWKPRSRPFVVNFLYAYSFPKRINLTRLIELGVIKDVQSAPRGFVPITVRNLRDILRECQADEDLAVD
ncbi:MAG: PIN domain-containing protein [Phycisphaerales bacterium]